MYGLGVGLQEKAREGRRVHFPKAAAAADKGSAWMVFIGSLARESHPLVMRLWRGRNFEQPEVGVWGQLMIFLQVASAASIDHL